MSNKKRICGDAPTASEILVLNYNFPGTTR